MKKVLNTAIALTLVSGLYVPQQALAADVGQAICGYVASDHKSRLRDQLRSNKIKLKKIYKGMTCNGESLLRFAMSKDAHSAGAFIAKRLPASTLAKAEADGLTILDWASANGKDGTATVAAIRKRMKL